MSMIQTDSNRSSTMKRMCVYVDTQAAAWLKSTARANGMTQGGLLVRALKREAEAMGRIGATGGNSELSCFVQSRTSGFPLAIDQD
jgi:hypothetical protein